MKGHGFIAKYIDEILKSSLKNLLANFYQSLQKASLDKRDLSLLPK